LIEHLGERHRLSRERETLVARYHEAQAIPGVFEGVEERLRMAQTPRHRQRSKTDVANLIG